MEVNKKREAPGQSDVRGRSLNNYDDKNAVAFRTVNPADSSETKGKHDDAEAYVYDSKD